jgi:uncharacterized lipoprotein YajG
VAEAVGGVMRSKLFRCALLLANILLVNGCAFTPHQLQLAPKINVAESEVGQGTKINFRFLDERDDTTIGHRSVATVGAKISAEQLPGFVEQQLRDGLAKKHYQFVDTESAANASVVYRLRALKFEIESGFFTGGRNASAALAVDVRRGQQSYTTVYRYNSEERILFLPGGDEIDNQMNEALGQILNKALADAAFDQFIAMR